MHGTWIGHGPEPAPPGGPDTPGSPSPDPDEDPPVPPDVDEPPMGLPGRDAPAPPMKA